MTHKRWIGVILAVCLLLVITGTPHILAQTQTHTVQPGETLMRIAAEHGVTVAQLASANGIVNPDRIYVGQVLVIPGAGPVSGGQTYRVQQGDTLFRIARQFGTTVDNLVALNGITNPNALYVGQMLVISPGAGASAGTSTGTTPTATSGTTAAATTTSRYTVQRGDTLYLIALRHGTTIQAIALLNGLTNPNLIFPGQVLVIPGAGASQVAGAATATITLSPTSISTPRLPTATLTSGSPAVVPTRTAVPTSTPSPTLTPANIVPESATNRLLNPDFEGRTRAVRFGEVNVFEEWLPFYCDNITVPGGCPALRIGTGNPPGLMMGRPEYKPTNVSNRVYSGATAQQWFCFSRPCRAGVYQTFNTTPGAICEVGAYIQSWSTNDSTASGWRSQLTTQDERDNSTWQILVDPNGGANPFASGVLGSATFGYTYEPTANYNRNHGGHGVYDQYVPISYTFIAAGTRATVFFQDTRLWPVENNDSYIDDAWARCTH